MSNKKKTIFVYLLIGFCALLTFLGPVRIVKADILGDDLIYSKDLSTIVSKTEIYYTPISTSSIPDEVRYTYYHIPFFLFVVIVILALWMASRFILEFIIRLRN